MAADYDEYNDDNIPDEDDGGEYVEIYSRKAIFWFTVFFTTLFGGIMLIINLRKAGYKSATLPMLMFAIGYYLLSSIIISSVTANLYVAAFMSLAANIIGGVILTQYYFVKYFPDDDYYPRSVSVPLLIALGLFLLQSVLASMLGLGNLTGM